MIIQAFLTSLYWLLLLLVGLISYSSHADTTNEISHADIPLAVSLQKDSVLTRQKNIPFLLYFSDPQCGYCRKLEKDILLPLLLSGDYEDRLLLRKMPWLSKGLVEDFDGKQREFSAVASRYKVRVTPSLVFVDARGNEIGKRILGYNGPDFFWFYLDRSISQAVTNINDGIMSHPELPTSPATH